MLRYKFYSSAIVSLFCLFIFNTNSAKALVYTDFKPGRIIDDVVFTNKSSMSSEQIQAFLNSKVPSCDSNHSGFNITLKSYLDGLGRTVSNTARFDPPFTCLKDYKESTTQTYTVNYSYINTGGATINSSITKKVNNSHRLQSVTFEYFGGNPANGISKTIATYSGVGGGSIIDGKSAAQIIYDAAQTYSINPQALITTLEKETSLITDTWAAGWQYDRAMGWACPDTGIGQSANCDTTKEGFLNQVMGAGWQFRNDFNGIDTAGFYSPYGKGVNNILYNPNVACGTRTVNVENQATAVIYKYTPYTPNDAAIIASPGVTVNCGAYGNRNFWRFFTDWFGTTYAPNYDWMLESQLLYMDKTKTTGAGQSMIAGGDKIYAVIKIKNTGNQTWTNSGSTPIRLGTSRPFERISSLCDDTWISCSRAASLTEPSVLPGATGTFEFWLKPVKSGNYQEYFTPVIENVSWLRDIGLFYTVKVAPPTYSWQMISQYAYTDSTKTVVKNLGTLVPGEKAYIGFRAKNTGNITWFKTGSYPVTAGTISPYERSSVFSPGSSWLSGTRPASFLEDSVPPGSVGTFDYWITAPSSPGLRHERFGLIANGLTWMNDTGLSFYTYVNPPTYSWQMISQYAYTDSTKTVVKNLGTLVPGEKAYIGFTAKNTGNTSWLNNGINAVSVGTLNPYERSSVFSPGSSWLSGTRPAVAKEAVVPPGSTGTFEFWITAPNSTGVRHERFGLIANGLMWLNDTGLSFYTEVK